MKSKLTLLFLAATTLPLQALFSQENPNQLDPVTVTASMNPIQTSRTGRNVFVIKGERFTHLPVRSVDELLRFLPGVEMQMRGPMGSQGDIVLRGGTFQQVLVLLDGLRLNDPNTGHFSGYIPIAPAEIDRIEILKGASSAIYGSEAVGGVIHIITHSFAARQPSAASTSLQADATAGEYSLLGFNGGGHFNTEKTAVSGGFLLNHSDGQPQRGTRGFLNNQTASLSATRFLAGNWKISARAAYDNRDFGAQNFYTTFVSDTAEETVTSWWTQLQVQRQGKKDRLTLDLGYKHLNDRFLYNSASIANNSKSELLQALLREDISLGATSTLTAGVQLLNKQIASNDRGNHNLTQAGAFLVLHQSIGDKWSLSPALRADWNQRSGWELIPQLNASYRSNNWQLRASAGKTTREADFTERYNNYNKALVTGGRIGNPDLQAEHSFSYEAGADRWVSNNLKLSATFFQRFHKRLIDWNNTPYADMPRKENLSPTGTYALAANIGKVNTRGAELEFQYQLFGHNTGAGSDTTRRSSAASNSPGQLWASGGLTWLESSTDGSQPSLYLSSHARILTNFNLVYGYRAFQLSLGALYKHRQPSEAKAINASVSPDYFLLNTKLQAFVWQRKLSVYVQVDNILDRQYQDLLGSVMPGRWVMGGLVFRK